MGTADDEQAWIEKSRNGDHTAFEALVRLHQRMIHSLTYRMTGSLADAEDLAQETFLRAYEQLDAFQGNSRFSSWLYRIAINACLNWRRREMRRHEVHSDQALAAQADAETAESASDRGRLSDEIQAALLRLPAKQRAAIVLTVYDGLNHAEAARVLNCSETTVSWRIFSARKKLKRWLEPVARGSPGR
jgi:RNA polymerase sigma-70 factor (ECF subfamily)